MIEAGLYIATDMSFRQVRLRARQVHRRTYQPRTAPATRGGGRHAATDDLYGLGLDPGEVVSRTRDDTLVIAIDGGAVPDRATGDDFEAKVAVFYGVRAEISKN